MSLEAGTLLGPYEILGLLGAGGMGEVYEAKDTRLNRAVAVKILPAGFSTNRERRTRFEREARTIAALSHPHICTLYDVGEHAGSLFLVMEHLAGETLAERLRRGAPAIGQSLALAAEIADALAAAHRAGIVHRDLKPANIMLTKAGAKLLDFGLAKLRAQAAADAPATTAASVATATAPLTGERTILGTLPYMAPELLEGKAADARTDLWSLGLILYEMVAGTRAFDAASERRLIADILERDPAPMSARQPLTPQSLDRVVARCLAKDPDCRWQSAADLAAELRWIAATEAGAASGGDGAEREKRSATRARMLTAIAGLVLLAIVATAILVKILARAPVTPPTSAPAARLSISLRDVGLTLLDGGIAVSPDGQTVVFRARAADSARLYARNLSDWKPRPLIGTEEGSDPFFSPDGEWVAYWNARGGFQKVALAGGPAQWIWRAREGFAWTTGAVWAPNEGIIFGQWPATGLWIVPADGGTPRSLHRASGEGDWCLWPEVLPGGKWVLFTTWRAGKMSIAALSLTGEGVRALPLESAGGAHYLPTGHLVYESDGSLFAARFDAESLAMGQPRALIPGIGRTGFGGSWRQSSRGRPFDVSPTGTLAYGTGLAAASRLVWKDRTGKTTATNLVPRTYNFPVLSPEGTRFVDTIYDGPARSLWTGSVDGEPIDRLTTGIDDCFALFTPDGRSVVFTSNRDGRYNLYRVDVYGRGGAELLVDTEESKRATSFSPDGKVMLFNSRSLSTGPDVWQWKDGASRVVLRTRFRERDAQFNRDAGWIAYTSNESGGEEVYVQDYPAGTRRSRISTGGGVGPVWNPRDANELFYQAPNAVMAVRIKDGRPASAPAVVLPHVSEFRDWDVSPDGRRFLLVEPSDPTTTPTLINIVTNWSGELTRVVKPGR